MFRAEERQRQRKFCSDACRIGYYRGRRYPEEPSEKECPACGITFRAGGRGGRRFYCSNACRIEYARNLRAEQCRSKMTVEERVCPQCGQTFQTERTSGSKQKRFCSKECKQNYENDQSYPGRHDARTCRACGAQFKREYRGQYYCGACRAAQERKKRELYEEKTCPNCSKRFLPVRSAVGGNPRRFCSRECAAAWWSVHRKARDHAQAQSAEEWREHLRRFTAENTAPKPPPRILLVCGISHISRGLENLLAVARYRLHVNPLGGDLFVFCGAGRKTLVTLEWDDGGLRIAKRRSQRGVYPWPSRRLGPLMEISEEEFQLLLSYSPKKILTETH